MGAYGLWECDRCGATQRFDDGVADWGVVHHRLSGPQNEPVPMGAWAYLCPACYALVPAWFGGPAYQPELFDRPRS
jgi:hypothetical protein